MCIRDSKWTDVDLNKGRVVYRDTKNGDTRSVALKGDALALMREHGRKARFTTEYVFQSRRKKFNSPNQKPWEDIKKSFNKAVKTAQIEDFRFHDLRHCAASYLLAAGASLAEVAKVLGHRSYSMSFRYSHLLQDKTDSLIEKVSLSI